MRMLSERIAQHSFKHRNNTFDYIFFFFYKTLKRLSRQLEHLQEHGHLTRKYHICKNMFIRNTSIFGYIDDFPMHVRCPVHPSHCDEDIILGSMVENRHISTVPMKFFVTRGSEEQPRPCLLGIGNCSDLQPDEEHQCPACPDRCMHTGSCIFFIGDVHAGSCMVFGFFLKGMSMLGVVWVFF